MQEWLTHLVLFHPYIVYGVVLLVACIEGPILSILLGIFIKLGYVTFVPIYITVMLGDLIGDILWYSIGYYGGHRFIARFGKYLSIHEEGVSAITRIFHTYKNRILIISKLTSGFGFAIVTLMTAGIVRIPFKRYIALNAIGQFVWSGMLLAVGYFFSQVYVAIDNILGKITIIMLFVCIILFFIGYAKYMRRKILTSNK